MTKVVIDMPVASTLCVIFMEVIIENFTVEETMCSKNHEGRLPFDLSGVLI